MEAADVGGAEAADLRREAMISKLAGLEAARQVEVAQRKQEAAEAADPRESIAPFVAQFGSQQASVAGDLEALTQAPPQDGDGKADAKEASRRLDELAATVFEMEKSAANASYFLPSYDLRQCNAAVAKLKQAIEDARAALVPKRKFAFSKKVARVKGAEMSVAAREAAGTATPASAGGTSATATAGTGITAGADARSGDPHAGGDAGPGSDSGSAHGAGAVPAAASASAHDLKLVAAGQGLMGLRDETVVLGPDQINHRDFVLIDLQRCTIFLMGHLPALRLLGLRDCTVVAGPVTGAVFVDSVTRCTLSLATYQARIHCTTDTDFYLRARSNPIVEHSSRVRFAPLVLAALGGSGDSGPSSSSPPEDAALSALLTRHKLGEETGMWNQVEDFGWIKASHSPNWAEVPVGERIGAVVVPWALAQAREAYGGDGGGGGGALPAGAAVARSQLESVGDEI
ncbi:hypothetical protein FOA52_012334 [Chlamydomonas sp. UWO 241]|nr:hypothetical protein FOA52_012334 [Chlamydomonas sp. UWO 241]